jgi:hypothetical protein
MLETCPDIVFAVTKLSQHATNPSEDHLNRALYVCHYLRGTSNYALVYDGPGNGGLKAYADSEWGLDPYNCKSTHRLYGNIGWWNLCVELLCATTLIMMS